MKKGRAANAVKQARLEANLTQEQMSFDELHAPREAISQQERGVYKAQPYMTKYFTEKHNDPWAAIEAANEYTYWGITRLDGKAADVNRLTAAIQSKIQMKEAMEAVEEAMEHLTLKPSALNDKRQIETSIQECLDVITALTQYVAVLCKEYSISWLDMWKKHHIKLIARGFVKN